MADKYRIKDSTTVSVGTQKFAGGTSVTQEKLGVTKKEFDKLVEDGTVVVVSDKRGKPKDQGSENQGEGSGEGQQQ